MMCLYVQKTFLDTYKSEMSDESYNSKSSYFVQSEI